MNLRLGLAVGALLLALGGGIAVAAETLDPSALVRSLEPSSAPSLLGPISVDGRIGWACEPERAAGAATARAAHLPPAEPAP